MTHSTTIAEWRVPVLVIEPSPEQLDYTHKKLPLSGQDLTQLSQAQYTEKLVVTLCMVQLQLFTYWLSMSRLVQTNVAAVTRSQLINC